MKPRIEHVKEFWERHPVAAASVPHPLGTREYFQFYDALRERNESPTFSRALHEYPRFRGRRVLDVGCGNGYVLSRYAREGARVFGVDLTDAAVRLCVARFQQERLAGDFCVGNAEELPFGDGAFDCVCSMGVLHHTPDTPRAVGEVWRVLKPGGRFIGMFYHRDSLVYRGKLRARSFVSGTDVEALVNEVDGRGNPKGDVYSKAELRKLFEGFRDPELFAGLLGGSGALRRLMRPVPRWFATWLERRWGWFLYVRAIRP